MNDSAASGQPGGWTQYERAMNLWLTTFCITPCYVFRASRSVRPKLPPRVTGPLFLPRSGRLPRISSPRCEAGYETHWWESTPVINQKPFLKK